MRDPPLVTNQMRDPPLVPDPKPGFTLNLQLDRIDLTKLKFTGYEFWSKRNDSIHSSSKE